MTSPRLQGATGTSACSAISLASILPPSLRIASASGPSPANLEVAMYANHPLVYQKVAVYDGYFTLFGGISLEV